MPRDFKLELRCKKTGDSFDGEIWDDNQKVEDSDYTMYKGTCEDMKELRRRARDKYHKNPEITGDCVECFTPEFFEAEALQP